MTGRGRAMSRTVLFLCPHAAAKSVLAAAYFDRLAAERGLAAWASIAGTEPDPRPAPAVVAALASEGIDVSGHRPRRVTAEDLVRAWRVVSIGCELDGIAPSGVALERWDDVPPISQDFPAAREVIRRRVARLINELTPEDAG
jgi:arsenate reductase (thioredoxin)